jgi:hypothetical protein
MTRYASGPRVAVPEPAISTINAATKPADQPQDIGGERVRTGPRVAAVFYPPSGRRTLGLIVVTRCPWCAAGGPHAHRGNAAEGLRRAGCDRGDYVLLPRPPLSSRWGAE